MSGFVIAEILEVSDPAGMKRYAEAAHATVEQYDGKYLVLRGKTEVLEGEWNSGPLVILEFPSPQRARDWYDSPEYRPLIEMRKAVSRTNFILLEGLE
ncbi:MAG: DUF1330 domain-containing protein [Panacagrimonas sp.]